MMKPDIYQQQVIDCGSSAVVSAGAGSGKTTVLSARFLRLITEGRADVSEILTLTFTRKAAAEMYERIYSMLAAERNNPKAAAAAADFDKASISTLDSFCSTIARDCSSMFGMPSTFATDESAVRALAEDISLDFILENTDNLYLQDFIYINGFENVWKNFFVYISLEYLALGAPVDFEEVCRRQLETAAAGFTDAAAEADRIISEMLAIEAVSVTIETAHGQLRGLEPFTAAVASGDYRTARTAAESIKLKKPGRASKPELIYYKELVDQLRAVQSELAELAGTLENRSLISGLFDLTAVFQRQLFSRKRSAGLLGFHDVLTIAVTGLKRDPLLRKFYKERFRYIMIDEFQDNNLRQKELLYLLAEADGNEGPDIPSADRLNPDKLFFVGDEKQSIYRFRGADVSVFKQLSDELSAAGGTALALKRNYRSEPGLIELFNNVFEHVMRDNEKDYQAEFVPLESRAAVIGSDPEVRLLYKPYDPALPAGSLPAEESEAEAIAEYILNSVGRLEVADKGTARTAEFSDFAMLFRSGTNQKTYEQVFRARGIPYNVHSVRSLFQEAPVNDIYNLLQICLYPDDRSASAAFLRSPFVNISDLSFAEFLLSGKRIFDDGMDECCLTGADLAKYRKAQHLCADVRSRLDREPLSDILTDIWYRSGYRYLLLGSSRLHGYLEYFDYLSQIAIKHDRDNKTAAEFLDYIRGNLGEYRKIDDLKILAYSTDGVEMMPVHQSKGLEFPIVIIANAGNVGVNDRGGASPAFISAADGLSFNLVPELDGAGTAAGRYNYFYRRGKEENRAREDAELRRLLYVALTRAESHLVIAGCHGRQNRSGDRSMLNMFMRSFGWSDGADPFECEKLTGIINRIENRVWTPDSRRLGTFVNLPAVSSLYREAEPGAYSFIKNEFSATELNALNKPAHDAAAELPELSPGLEKLLRTEGLEADFGTLSHRVIECCIKQSRADSMPSSDELRDMLQGEFALLSGKNGLLLIEGASELASRFFSSDIWRESADSLSFESELAFTALRTEDGEECFVNGIIDLLFEMDNLVQIIDFKTDRRIIPDEYRKQMEIYIDAVESMYSKPARCSLYYLRGGETVEITV